MEEVERVVEKILGLFRQHQYHAGDVLTEQHLSQFLQTLNSTEQELIGSAMHHLESIEFIEVVGREHVPGNCYKLTEKGYCHIHR